MKRSTAMKRLADVVEGLDRAAAWPETTLAAACVFGTVLSGDPELDRLELALVVDEPPEAVPWRSQPAHLEALAGSLRFTKLPLSWCWRPAEWPVWNHQIDRAVRFWTAKHGGDQRVLAMLAAGRVDDGVVEAPADGDELRLALVTERDVSRRHLATVTALFCDRDWRRAHRGDGVYPEDHLWLAAAGFLDLDDAIASLDR